MNLPRGIRTPELTEKRNDYYSENDDFKAHASTTFYSKNHIP